MWWIVGDEVTFTRKVIKCTIDTFHSFPGYVSPSFIMKNIQKHLIKTYAQIHSPKQCAAAVYILPEMNERYNVSSFSRKPKMCKTEFWLFIHTLLITTVFENKTLRGFTHPKMSTSNFAIRNQGLETCCTFTCSTKSSSVSNTSGSDNTDRNGSESTHPSFAQWLEVLFVSVR